MRIALTGATGFVGRQVLALLAAAGHDVAVLVRNAKTAFAVPCRIIVGDLANASAMAELVASVDVVLHLAGEINPLKKADYLKTNFSGTRNIFEAAAAAQVKRFVFVSSLAARLPEISPYAASKRAAEDFLQTIKYGPPILILRPCAVYGPGDKATLPLLATLQNRIALVPGSAASRFSLIHVDDLAWVIVNSAQSSATGVVEVDDLSGGHDWAELAAVSLRSGGYPRRVAYLPQALVRLVALAHEALSFFTRRPSMINRAKVRELYVQDWVVKGSNWQRTNPISLADGLNQTLQWYRNEGLLPPVSSQFKSV